MALLGRRRNSISGSVSFHNNKGNNRQRSQCRRLLPFLATTAAACVSATRQHQSTASSALTSAKKEAWTLPSFVPRQQWTIQQHQQQYGTCTEKSASSSLCLNEFLLRFRGGSSDRNGDTGGPSSYYNSNDYYQRGQPGKAAAPPAPPSTGYDSYRDRDDVKGDGGGGGDDYEDNDNDRYYNDNDYDYDDRGLDRPPTSSNRRGRDNKTSNNSAAAAGKNYASSILDSIPLPSIIKTGDRRIGFMLLSAGAVLTMLGISLFFNKALLRMGNLLFIAGVPMTLGPSRTAGYFLQTQKLRATAVLGFGIFLVLIGSPVFGMVLEIFGLLNLFGNMFPLLLAIAKQMPVIGPILSGGSGGGGGGGGNARRNNNNNNNRQGNNNNNRRRQEEEDYYSQEDEQSYNNEGDGWRDDGGSGDRYY